MDRGLELKSYKSLIWNLINGDTEGMERKEYKKAIISSFVNMMEKNWIQRHVYEDMVDLDFHNTGYVGKITIHLDDNRESYDHTYISFTFLGDCVSLSCNTFGQMYLKY